jgi:peptidoglycan/LPS O-acetylase OafA/YrhL
MGAYRPDIDGLRAICIVSVVMFHAGFSDWSGGFVGVDIFFVISGFLITSLIVRQMQEGRFSLLRFYERRVRRLLAATIPVLVFTTLFAVAFYTSENLVTYCTSLLAFATYTANWFFLSETGYFGTAPEVSPLLHSWSLAIEEQFYLFFPALLLVLVRFPRAMLWCLAALAVLSFGYAQIEISRGLLDRAFFSSFSRFWELLAGALLAIAPWMIGRTEAIAFPMRLAGLVMVIAPVFLYGHATPFPGVAALLPVCGALFIIAASPAARDPAWRALSAAPIVYVGRISYSLYLWHWPIFGATRTLAFNPNDFHMALAIALSVALAALSYHWIEQPVRKRRILPGGRHMAGMLSATSTVVAVVAAAGWAQGGWPGRFAPNVEATMARATIRSNVPRACYERSAIIPDDRRFCTFGLHTNGGVDLLLWGDSHANAIASAFKRYAEVRGLSFAFAGRGDCPPLLDTWRSNDAVTQDCRKFNDAVRIFVHANKVAVVVLAARWSAMTDGNETLLDKQHWHASHGQTRVVFENGLKRTIDALEGSRVVILEQVPQHRAKVVNAYLVLNRLGGSIDTVAASLASHEKRQRFTTKVLDRITSVTDVLRIDPAEKLCSGERCIVQSDGRLLYFDHNHLNLDGSLFVYPLIETKLDQWLGNQGIRKAGD